MKCNAPNWQTLRPWLILFFVALVLRLGMTYYWEARNPEGFYFGDSDTYWQLGKEIAAGRSYSYGGAQIHRMPGYPVLLAPLFLAFGENAPILAARLENVLVGTLTVGAIAWLAWLLFRDRHIALIAAWFTALDPLNVVLSVLVLSETPFCLAMTLHLGFWILALQHLGLRSPASRLLPPTFYLVAAGVFAAGAIYCRPSWLYFVPFATLIGAVLVPKNFAEAGKIIVSGLIVSVVLSLCLLPWWVRNYQISGHFVSTTLQMGPSLYDGLHSGATGASDMSFVEVFRDTELLLGGTSEASKPRGLTGVKETIEYRLNRKMRQAAMDWAWNNPEAAWKLAWTKFIRLWNVWPNEESFSRLGVRAVVFCSYFPVLVLGLIGVLRSFWSGFTVRLLWIPALYITVLHTVFVSSIRYRAPAMICFSILAAWVLVDLSRLFFSGKKKRTA